MGYALSPAALVIEKLVGLTPVSEAAAAVAPSSEALRELPDEFFSAANCSWLWMTQASSTYPMVPSVDFSGLGLMAGPTPAIPGPPIPAGPAPDFPVPPL